MGKTKRYGVTGLMEWQCTIKSGKARFSFYFSGGTLTAYGVTPAVYETANPLFQQVIESSNYFKSGKITKLKGWDDEDEQTVHGEVPSGILSSGAIPDPPGTEENTENDGGDTEHVVVPSFADARQYLIEHYGAEASKLLSKDAVAKYAKGKGIEIVYNK